MAKKNFRDLVDEIKKLPVALVIGTVIPVHYTHGKSEDLVSDEDLRNVNAGRNYFSICPFHSDESRGSFVITPSKNMWYCFVDKVGWSGIHFEMKYFELDFHEAVLHLARRFSIISEEEYEKLGKGKVDEKLVRDIEISMKTLPTSLEVSQKADPDVIRCVYNHMPGVCGLKARDMEHLIKERGLTKDEIGDYFSFPTRKFDMYRHIMEKVADELSENKFGKPYRNLNEAEKERIDSSKALKRLKEQFPLVPGFFMDTRRNKVDFASKSGIGFIVRDEKGAPLGIQIRKNKVNDGEPRYVWFSSVFARTKDGCSMGNSSGSPGGAIMPKAEGCGMLCITEGRFKAEQIAKKGNIAVYISGVSTWRNVVPMINRIKGQRKDVYLMFDADMMGNTSVHTQLKEIAQELERHGLKVHVIVWPISKGKGFDDLVLKNGDSYSKFMKSMLFKNFEEKYEKALSCTLGSFGAERIRDIRIEDREAFNKAIQKNVEQAVGIKEDIYE